MRIDGWRVLLLGITGAFGLLVVAGCSKSSQEEPSAHPVTEGSTEEAGSHGATPNLTPGSLTVVFTNNIDGEIEPCG